MLYREWIDTRWRDSKAHSRDEKEQAEDWLEYLEAEKQKAIDCITKHFTKEPKAVMSLTREAFFSLPLMKNINWPDIFVVEEWLTENASDEWMRFDTTTFIFVNEEDALAFVLKWSA